MLKEGVSASHGRSHREPTPYGHYLPDYRSGRNGAGLTLFTIIRWTLDLVIGNDPPMPWWPLGLVVALALLRLLHHKDATDDRQASDSTPPDFSSEIKSIGRNVARRTPGFNPGGERGGGVPVVTWGGSGAAS